MRELPIPEIGDDEVLVKVEGCGICGTDVHEYKGDPFGYIPIELGHEGTGTVVKLGKNVTKDYSGKPLQDRSCKKDKKSQKIKSITETNPV